MDKLPAELHRMVHGELSPRSQRSYVSSLNSIQRAIYAGKGERELEEALGAKDFVSAGAILRHNPSVPRRINYHGDNEVLLMLQHGASPNPPHDEGISPLHGVAQNGSPEVMHELVKRGAAVDARTRHGYAPLHAAASHDKVDAAEVLLQAGADVNIIDSKHRAPLHYATSPEMVTILAAHGADTNARDILGRTPLHRAAKHGKKAIPALLEHGADHSVADMIGDMPRDILAHATLAEANRSKMTVRPGLIKDHAKNMALLSAGLPEPRASTARADAKINGLAWKDWM